VAVPLKNPTLNFHRTLFRLLDKKIGLARTMKIDEKLKKNRLIDETINRLIF
jgi:hypothetical protein